MRSLFASAALLALVTCSDPGGDHLETMQEIEKLVQLPPGAAKLDEYARYYAVDGKRVTAVYTAIVDRERDHLNLPVGKRRWVEDSDQLPGIMDGGCLVVIVVYDPETHRVEQATCNGDA